MHATKKQGLSQERCLIILILIGTHQGRRENAMSYLGQAQPTLALSPTALTLGGSAPTDTHSTVSPNPTSLSTSAPLSVSHWPLAPYGEGLPRLEV